MNFLDRSVRKFLRDLIVVFVGAGLLAVAENVGDLGLPETAIPTVSALALLGYRLVRDWGKEEME